MLGTVKKKMDEWIISLRNIQKVKENLKLTIVEEIDKFL